MENLPVDYNFMDNPAAGYKLLENLTVCYNFIESHAVLYIFIKNPIVGYNFKENKNKYSPRLQFHGKACSRLQFYRILSSVRIL